MTQLTTTNERDETMTRKTAATVDVDLYTDAVTGRDDQAREAFMAAVAETVAAAVPAKSATIRGNMILGDVVTEIRTEWNGTHVYVYAAAPNQRPEYVSQAYAVIRAAIETALAERFGRQMAYIAVR